MRLINNTAPGYAGGAIYLTGAMMNVGRCGEVYLLLDTPSSRSDAVDLTCTPHLISTRPQKCGVCQQHGGRHHNGPGDSPVLECDLRDGRLGLHWLLGLLRRAIDMPAVLAGQPQHLHHVSQGHLRGPAGRDRLPAVSCGGDHHLPAKRQLLVGVRAHHRLADLGAHHHPR